MIIKSIILVLILLAGFEASLRIWPMQWDTSQNDKSANIISAQDFVYDLSKIDLSDKTIIIGSSKSKKLITEVLGEKYINLSFNGWGSIDGLDLLKRAKVRPESIAVESYSLAEEPDKSYMADIFDPVINYKPYVKSLQLKNQPVGLLIGYLKEKMKAEIIKAKNKKHNNPALYSHTIKMAKQNYSKPMNDSLCISKLDKIQNLIKGFQDQNIKIFFFEVPIDTALINTAYISSARNKFKEYFPTSVYQHISNPVNNYIFSDGVHLAPKSAVLYTKYLKDSLSNHLIGNGGILQR